jgi:hypothetical protein
LYILSPYIYYNDFFKGKILINTTNNKPYHFVITYGNKGET